MWALELDHLNLHVDSTTYGRGGGRYLNSSVVFCHLQDRMGTKFRPWGCREKFGDIKLVLGWHIAVAQQLLLLLPLCYSYLDG